jgi:hypothetical protein
MVGIELKFGVPDGIVADLEKIYSGEKENDLLVTRPRPLNPPYYAWGDPRSQYETVKFQGKDYWVYKVTKGKDMNWVYTH